MPDALPFVTALRCYLATLFAAQRPDNKGCQLGVAQNENVDHVQLIRAKNAVFSDPGACRRLRLLVNA